MSTPKAEWMIIDAFTSTTDVAEKEATDVDRVAADVHQGPAAVFRLVAYVVGVVSEVGEPGLDG